MPLEIPSLPQPSLLTKTRGLSKICLGTEQKGQEKKKKGRRKRNGGDPLYTKLGKPGDWASDWRVWEGAEEDRVASYALQNSR